MNISMKIPEFKYLGFEPNDPVIAEAEGVIESLQYLVPHGATIAALLSFDQHQYTCSIQILLRRGSVSVSTHDPDIFNALLQAERKTIEKLSKQKQTRFFSRDPQLTAP